MTLKRTQKIKQKLKEKKADAFLLVNHEYSGQPGTRYFSGFSGSESIIVVTKGKKFIITDGRYYAQAKKEASLFKLIPSGRFSYLKPVQDLIKKFKIKTFLIDGYRTFYVTVERLQKAADVAFIDAPCLLQEIRVVKDRREIKLLKRAADIAGKAFLNLLPLIREGVTEKWLAAKLEFLMKEHGSDRESFDTIVASGKNGAMPHARPTDKKIKKGELITFDFGAAYEGYMSDTTRTVAIGTISAKLKKIYEVVRHAQELGVKKARAGVSGADIDRICRIYIQKQGFGKYFLHATGHGLGMEVHELPIVGANFKDPLPKGAVVTCEPGIYIEGVGGVRIEDALVLKDYGNLNLSEKIPKSLITLGS